jgi:hypothetical protein
MSRDDAGRLVAESEPRLMAKPGSAHYTIESADSSLRFFSLTTMYPAFGKVAELTGSIDAASNADGTIVLDPTPRMHIEFKVEDLRTGNELQDHEMWKLIDSKRFPKIAGDLRELEPGAVARRYNAAGQITLAGLARPYEGELSAVFEDEGVTIDGDLQIDVRDFGLKPMKLLVLSVAPLVKVRLHLVASAGD